ncbi:MAG: exonuclease domain-containing protein [Candidatus Dojkabacteria bacterium]
MQEKFLYFDTETTDIQSKDIIQLAIVTDDGISLSLYFKPIQSISFAAMAIHHITPEFLKDKPEFTETEYEGKPLKEYLEKLTKEYVWIAHNVEFDMEVLKKKGIDIPKYICTFKLARNMFSEENDKRDLESYSLQYLRYYLGLYKKEDQNHNTAHDALSDVYFVRDLFKYIQDNSTFTVDNMITVSQEPQYIRSLNFGKYAGRTLEDVAKLDREYLEWLMGTVSDKEDLVWNIERVLNLRNMTLFQ